MITTSDAKPPWVIVSREIHTNAGQPKSVAALVRYLSGASIPVHLVGDRIDSNIATLPGVTVHRILGIGGPDVVGNLLVFRTAREVARRITRCYPGARVVVSGGNCVWADVNWVHYLHLAWSPDLTAAPRWFRHKEQLVGAWYRQTERRAMQVARLVITNSQTTSADVLRNERVEADRVRTIYYGADPSWSPPTDIERRQGRERFGLHPDRPVVSFVGGFGYDNRKGFDTLIAAWVQLCRDPSWDADLVLAGGGKAVNDVAAQLTQQGLGDRVRILGFTDRVFELLAGSDLLVSPVRYEPYGLNVQEAICRGVPAVVSACAGVAEEYPTELNAMLLPDPNDAEGLAFRLKLWRSDMSGWRNKFRPFSARLRSRSWDDMSREIVETVTAFPPPRSAP